MLLTITSTTPPATDLGFLLHKNPSRAQTFTLGFGQAHVFYPEATPERCTACDFCFDVCPFDAIKYRTVDDGFFNVAEVNPEVCKGCDALCVSVCIKEAIRLVPRDEAAPDPKAAEARVAASQ